MYTAKKIQTLDTMCRMLISRAENMAGASAYACNASA